MRATCSMIIARREVHLIPPACIWVRTTCMSSGQTCASCRAECTARGGRVQGLALQCIWPPFPCALLSVGHWSILRRSSCGFRTITKKQYVKDEKCLTWNWFGSQSSSSNLYLVTGANVRYCGIKSVAWAALCMKHVEVVVRFNTFESIISNLINYISLWQIIIKGI